MTPIVRLAAFGTAIALACARTVWADAPQPTPPGCTRTMEEVAALRQEAVALRQDLNSVRKQIARINEKLESAPAPADSERDEEIDRGDKVTLRAESINVRSLLLGLAKQTGMNIIVDSDVDGTVVAYLSNVTVLRALRTIAEQVHATVVVKGDIIRIEARKD